jgi:spore maturation protein CgeB
MNVLYSFNKSGRELEIWTREIQAASSPECTLIPFNHGEYIDPRKYSRAQMLDDLFFSGHRDLTRLYTDVEAIIRRENIDVLLVDNCPPYHPEFLSQLEVYKALRVSDGPVRAYDRDFAYAHAYNHVLYHSAAYSEHVTMPEKLLQMGAKRVDFWPLALFDAGFDPKKSIEDLLQQPRDVEIVFVGAMHFEKMPQMALLKKAFGKRILMHGLTTWRRNAYFNLKFGFPGWLTPISIDDYVPLYQRSKIGINIHNRGKFTAGNYRMFELPANGVMQISDGDEYLEQFFSPGVEIESYRNLDDAIAKTEYFLSHEKERKDMVRAGYEATLSRHRFSQRIQELMALLQPRI